MFFIIDETGLRTSKYGRAHAHKVIIPKAFARTSMFTDPIDSHVVTPFCAISAAGNVLVPGLMRKKASDHTNAEETSYVTSVCRYSSCLLFSRVKFLRIISAMFSHHTPHIGMNPSRRMHGESCYFVNTGLILPPLDQELFRRLKIQYGPFHLRRWISKISRIMVRI
jgi:hypothetical protein